MFGKKKKEIPEAKTLEEAQVKNTEDMEHIAQVIKKEPVKELGIPVPEPKQAMESSPVEVEVIDLADDLIMDYPSTRQPDLMEAAREWRDSLTAWYDKNWK